MQCIHLYHVCACVAAYQFNLRWLVQPKIHLFHHMALDLPSNLLNIRAFHCLSGEDYGGNPQKNGCIHLHSVKYGRACVETRFAQVYHRLHGRSVNTQLLINDCHWKKKQKIRSEGDGWVFPKIGAFPPKSSILIGFSIVFTIHFGGFPPIFGNTRMDGENVWFLATTVVPIEPGPVAQLLVRERPKRALGKKKTDVVDDALLMYSGSLPFQNKTTTQNHQNRRQNPPCWKKRLASVSQTSQPLKRLKNIPTAPQPAPSSKTRQFRQDFSTWQSLAIPKFFFCFGLVYWTIQIPKYLNTYKRSLWLATFGLGGTIMEPFLQFLWGCCLMNFLTVGFLNGFVLPWG